VTDFFFSKSDDFGAFFSPKILSMSHVGLFMSPSGKISSKENLFFLVQTFDIVVPWQLQHKLNYFLIHKNIYKFIF
jgi:hypothetical protein